MKKVLILPALFVLLMISSCKDKEKDVAVESVTIDNGATASLTLGETLTLKATVLPGNATSKQVTWSSTETSIASVSGGRIECLVTPLKEGETIISATAGGITAKCTVTVLPKFIPLTKISFTTDKMTLVINDKKTLIALFTPANASDKAVVWNSDKNDIATVSQSGEIEAKKVGTCQITVKSSKSPSIAATCEVEVVAAPISLTGLKAIPSDTTLEKGLPFQLRHEVKPANATTHTEVIYLSSDVTKAIVTETGEVTAKDVTSPDSPVIITVKSKGAPSISATCRLTIVAATVRVSSITISPNTLTLSVGQKKALEATVMPSNATNKTVTWTSSDESKATISKTGEVTGTAPGEVYITASATDGSNVSAAKTVTVTSNDASLTAMTLGAANHAVTPIEGQTVNLKNVERTFYSTLTAVPVTITAAAGATVKAGTTDFTSGGNVDFTNPVVFTVTAADGVTTKTYTVGVPAYDAATNSYGVYTAAHLNDVRNDKAGSYLMKNNITLPERNEAGKAAIGITDYIEKGWLPIAHDATFSSDVVTVTGGFTGKFDGGSFSVDNIYINRSGSWIGLFGLAYGATIQNLGVTGTASPAVTGGSASSVGALAGYIKEGLITNCYASASVSYLASNEAGSPFVGGLVGSSDGAAISKSYSSGNISLNSRKVTFMGGFAGMVSNGTINDCFATGNSTATYSIVIRGGGFAGLFLPTTSNNCYSTGNVVVTAGNTATLGGFTGETTHTYTNCYRNSEALLTKNGDPVASADASKITAKTKEQMQSDAFKGLLNGSGNIWGRDANKNDGLPYIKGVGVGK